MLQSPLHSRLTSLAEKQYPLYRELAVAQRPLPQDSVHLLGEEENLPSDCKFLGDRILFLSITLRHQAQLCKSNSIQSSDLSGAVLVRGALTYGISRTAVLRLPHTSSCQSPSTVHPSLPNQFRRSLAALASPRSRTQLC